MLSDSGKQLDLPTMEEMRQIKLFASQLMTTRFIHKLMEDAGYSITSMEEDLSALRSLALADRIPRAYLSLIQFFEKWKNFLWVAWTEDAVQHALRYHFFSLDDEDQLYESWVCFKILRSIVDLYDLVLVERNSKTGILFRSTNGLLSIRYQKRFPTGWEYGGEEKEAVPDVIVESSGESKLVIDAKNTLWDKTLPDGFRRQVGEYLNLTNCRCGLLIHSCGPSNVWEKMTKRETGQEINWTQLSPGQETNNRIIIAKIMGMIH